MSRGKDQCGDQTCTEDHEGEHGDEPDPTDDPTDDSSMAIYDASLHYRNGQR